VQRDIGPALPEEAGGAEGYWSFTTRGEQEEQKDIAFISRGEQEKQKDIGPPLPEESRRSRRILPSLA
jgi:hypothetical protein